MASNELEHFDAISLIKSVDDVDTQELCLCLERLFDIFSSDELAETYFVQQSLPYGREVARNGQWIGHSDPLPDNFYNRQGFPLALVTKGALEIYRPGNQYTKNRVTDAVLYAGHFVGIFEAFQDIFSRVRPVSSFWNISSGVTSCYLPDQFTKVHSKSLNTTYQTLVDPSDLEDGKRLYEQCRNYDKIISQIEANWKTELLYFPQSFLDFVYKHELHEMDNQRKSAILEARRVIGDYALLAYTKSFGSSFPLTEYFDSQQVRFLESLISVKNSERPVFALSQNFENAMPSSSVVEHFCTQAGALPYIIAPKRFEKLTHCGFIPISHLMDNDSLNTKANIQKLLTGIRAKLRNLNEVDTYVAAAVEEVISGIHVAVGKGAGASGFRVDPSNGEIVEISAREFFEVIAGAHNWDMDGEDFRFPSSDFFSKCVMIPVNGTT